MHEHADHGTDVRRAAEPVVPPPTAAHRSVRSGRHGRADDRGEGVVSLSIAILIVAGLAALMWVGLREIWFEAESTTRDRVAEIGQ